MKRGPLPLIIKVTLVLAALLVGARLAAPYVLKNWINRTIADLPDYSGEVGDVDLRVWHGGIGLDDIKIYRDSMSKTVPIFSSERIETSTLWGPLLRGDLVSRALITKPKIELSATSDRDAKKEAKELKKDVKEAESAGRSSSGSLLERIPIKIDRFEVTDGLFRLRKTDAKPPIDVRLSDIHLVVKNLTNSQRLSDSLVAQVSMTAKVMGQGDFTLNLAVNPTSHPIDFDLKSKLMNLPAKTLNALANEYGKFDFEKGSIDIVTEVKVEGGQMDGYVKPLFQNIEISGSGDKTRDDDGILRRAWEAIVGAGEEVVENKSVDQSGSRIPIKGKLNDPGTDLYASVVAVLRNAYVKALVPNYESE